MKFIKLLALVCLLCPAAFGQCTLINSTTGGGNWSSTSTWSGGVVPGANNCVTINGPVVINQNIGASGAGNGIGWIRIQATAANLTVASGASYTITFNSSGTNPTGSGTATNPGADATEYGFFVSFGTLNLTASASNPLTITSQNGTSPVYVHSEQGDFTGCTTITTNVCNGSTANHVTFVTLQYDNFGPAVGGATANYEGIHFDLSQSTAALNIQNCEFTSLDQILIVSTNTAHVTISNNYFNAPTNASSGTATIYNTANGGAGQDWVITNNTEIGATVNGTFLSFQNYPSGLTFTGNAVEGTASVTRTLLTISFYNTNDIGHNISGNLMYNPSATSIPTTYAILFNGYQTDTTTSIKNNVLIGAYQGLYLQAGAPVISGNFILGHQDAVTAGAQGPVIIYGLSGMTWSGLWQYNNNITGYDNSTGTANLNTLPFTSPSTCPTHCNQFILQNNTYSNGISGNPGLSVGEGGTSTSQGLIINSSVRNNISINGSVGFQEGDSNNTYNSSYYFNSVGVHHNSTYNNSVHPYESESGSTTANFSANWDNGTTHHPSSIYGDLTINPQMVNTSVSISTFASWCGATNVTGLFSNLSYQSTFGGTYNAGCSISSLLLYLQSGFQPMNGQFKNAGWATDCGTTIGCDVGAVPVYPATSMAIL